MTKNTYHNEIITDTVVLSDLLTGMTIGTLQEDYPLSEADFLRLKANQTATTSWAVNFLFATIGYGISIAPKWLSELAGQTNQLTKAEWVTFFTGIAFSVFLYGAGWALPNDRKSTMTKIELHFKSAPKSRQLIRGQKK